MEHSAGPLRDGVAAGAVLKCPGCERIGTVLVSYPTLWVVHTIGKGHFHAGHPWGDQSQHGIPDGAEAVCQHTDCSWTGNLRDAILDR